MSGVRTTSIVAAPPPFLADPAARPACRAIDVNPEWFFPTTGHYGTRGDAALARAVCQRCPLQKPCADYAADTKQEFGIWSGMDPAELKQYRACRAGACLHPEHRKATS
jgi:WhiB family redox-sensing transcriptional regulator